MYKIQTDRERESYRQIETERHPGRYKKSGIQTDRERDAYRQIEKERHTDRQIEKERHTDR